MQTNGGEPWRRLELPERLPTFIRRLLHLNCGDGALGRSFQQRSGVEIHGLEKNFKTAETARTVLDSVIEDDLDSVEWPFPKGYFDAIVATDIATLREASDRARADLLALLSSNGRIVTVVPNPKYGKSGPEHAGSSAFGPEQVEALFARSGFGLYVRWHTEDREAMRRAASGGASVVADDIQPGPASRERLRERYAVEYALEFVRMTYNPVSHARELLASGRHPGWAYEILMQIPEAYQHDAAVAAVIAAETMLALLAWDNGHGPDGRVERFFNSQVMLYRTVARQPDIAEAYHIQAEFWRRIGDDAMAARLLRSIEKVHSTAHGRKQLEALGDVAEPPERDDRPPTCAISDKPPRILLITHLRPDFGLDVLYHGLCMALGNPNVVEFPWKPTLHGVKPIDLAQYPCAFEYPGPEMDLNGILRELEQGRFDLVAFGDTERHLDADAARRLVEAAAGVPLCVVDQQDDPRNNCRPLLEYLGMKEVCAYFKRELLRTVDFGPNVFPLPFGYPDERVPQKVPEERTNAVFWAGHRRAGLRRLYLEHIERNVPVRFDEVLDQDKYVAQLLASRIGLSFFGFGFDTVRYWELPAHGCMLLSERLPIRVPANFRDGESAVFFDDIDEMEQKLTYYMGHPDETAAIARRGREHLARNHTASARARQFLTQFQEAARQVAS